MDSKQPQRTLEDLTEKIKPIIHKPALIKIAVQAESPTIAKKWAEDLEFEDNIAKAVRWAAVIIRDYGREALNQILQQSQEVSQ